jgi:hypothetical protein
MKIRVKDYYALKRANARATKLSSEDRKEIARRAAAKRWSKVKSFKQTLDVVK